MKRNVLWSTTKNSSYKNQNCQIDSPITDWRNLNFWLGFQKGTYLRLYLYETVEGQSMCFWGPTSLKLTPTAEQDQETTKRREEVDGRNIGSSLDLWSDNSIATAIIKHAHFWNPSQIFVLGNFYALFTFLPLLDCPFGASFVFVLLLVRLIFNTLFYTRDLCRQARLERVSSCAFQVKF